MKKLIFLAFVALTLASCSDRTILALYRDGRTLNEPVKWVIKGTDVYMRQHFYYGDELVLEPTASYNPLTGVVTFRGLSTSAVKDSAQWRTGRHARCGRTW